MRLLVRHIQNPMGELELSNAEREKAEREDGVWREILDRYRRGRPVTGRILNPVNGGYAVGVAGLVCFLPNATARGSRDGGSAPPAGELMSFKIINITEAIRNVILAGPVDGEYASRGGGRGGRPAWASAPRGNARGKGGKDASSLAEGAAGGGGVLEEEGAREERARGERLDEARREGEGEGAGGAEGRVRADGEGGRGRAADVEGGGGGGVRVRVRVEGRVLEGRVTARRESRAAVGKKFLEFLAVS